LSANKLKEGVDNMALNDRKIQILQAIINDYIATAEPVGSRTIAKKYNLGISSATIRNEMSDLEEMGFIIQPHASAGRIPSDLGYRLYVDRLMQKRELKQEEQQLLQSVVTRNISQIDYLMEETAKAISMLTNYTTLISEPVSKGAKLKQIRLLPLDSESVVLVIATDGNYIKNHVLKLSVVPEEQKLFDMGRCINNILKGCTWEDIDERVVVILKKELQEYAYILPILLSAIEKTTKGAENIQVHLSGTKNILAFPEFSDIQRAKSLFQTLEQKDVLITLLEEQKNDDMQILIGSENTLQSIKDCSVITTTYKMGDGTRGTIGILGPTRMDYSQVVSVLNSMVKNIENVLQALTDKKNDT